VWEGERAGEQGEETEGGVVCVHGVDMCGCVASWEIEVKKQGLQTVDCRPRNE
jgi:hypothetical protein